ncbi:N6-Methyl-AMP deaminase-like isoform X2 [Apostichopus japonicus]|uniref:N6-Methyl-AMP deaminase-like isoform X2 n=1 Tax=Stichopus japonicus TaxID=307972 RepID=UPI003AB790B9
MELHAHLNGSISTDTLQKLSARKSSSDEKASDLAKLAKWKKLTENREQRSLEDCFEIFPLVHKLVDDAEAVAIATRDVIQEFAADNVKYLELRSSPKENPSTGLTRRTYIETVLKEIKQSNYESNGILTRFLLSIDRKVPLPVMGEVVKLAEEFHTSSEGLLVGLDLSGDPFTTNVSDIIPLLSRAKNAGLKLALHLAETDDRSAESLMLLQVPPDRIGHGTFIHPAAGGTDEMEELVNRLKIPIECCLTSNLISRTVKSYSEHHFKYWLNKNHPVVLCTDDKGVFSTNLSEEYRIAAETYNLQNDDLWRISNESINYIFADDATKTSLRDEWQICR